MWCNGSTNALGAFSPSSNLGIPTKLDIESFVFRFAKNVAKSNIKELFAPDIFII